MVALDGTVSAWDEVACELFGYSADEAVGHPFSDLFDAGYPAAGFTRAARADPLRLLATGRRKDGGRFEAEIACSAAPEGPARIVERVRDLTEQRAVEDAVAAVAGALDAPAALAALARSLRLRVPFAGLALGIVEGQRYRRLIHAARRAMKELDRDGLRPGASAVHDAVTSRATVTVLDTGRGRFRPDCKLAEIGVGSYVVSPLVDGGRVVAVLNVAFARPGLPTAQTVRLLRSVACAVAAPLATTLEFERQSLALRRGRERLQMHEEFLAGTAHDMQTPLAVIAGVTDSLLGQWEVLGEDEKLADLEVVARNCENLTHLVDQDLQAALADADELRYDIHAFDLAEQVEQVVSDFASDRIEVRIESSLPPVRGDKQRNRQVLGNLLANALHFSPPPERVELSVARSGAMAEVRVRDHGVGIPAVDLPTVFRKFGRVSWPRGGSGLGLYLARKMVEAQGGRISVDSRAGKGSTFSYTLPLELP